ncbi:hypothetical protein KC19_11G147700 [Ceratodon purpureus]|uniref:Uncharacterized protein n=1 Tax=Ceratodon purpureus TaxID=3225 RepID=A0A8T0GH90_CERPU|nr:hypothetical protein KC19_11G147700 [Ceratodon purpureus]
MCGDASGLKNPSEWRIGCCDVNPGLSGVSFGVRRVRISWSCRGGEVNSCGFEVIRLRDVYDHSVINVLAGFQLKTADEVTGSTG